MGLNLLRRSCYTNPSQPAPSPRLFTVEKVKKVDKLYVSLIRYHNATNMEGLKCLVTRFNPKKRSVIDPHFSESLEVIARMLPTKEGYDSAIKYAEMIQEP